MQWRSWEKGIAMVMDRFMKSDLSPLSAQCHSVVEEKESSVPPYTFFFLFILA